VRYAARWTAALTSSACSWVTASWSLSARAVSLSAPIFDTAIAPMTTSARPIAPNATLSRCASRRSLKRDMLPPGKQKMNTQGPG